MRMRLFVVAMTVLLSVVVLTVTRLPEVAAQPAVTNISVKVYFSKFSDTNPARVYAVDRSSPTTGVATFSIQLLIAGPTLSERDLGYYSELNSIFSGPSVCNGSHPTGGPDFTITLDHRGPKPEPGTATLKFCRATSSGGVLQDARILAGINATLKQFSTIKNVVVLTKDGHCFGDLSGLDRCLK
jgi:hypothetical protein